MIEAEQNRGKWVQYLNETETYGTYADRVQEYRAVHEVLKKMGLKNDDLIVDVGAGPCDFDRYLREAGWHGRYWPIDGAVQGVDFTTDDPDEYLPVGRVDWVVCIETIEHIPARMEMLSALRDRVGYGLVITTPNGEIMDVSQLDPTHVDSYDTQTFTDAHMQVFGVTFSPERPQPDTLIAYWQAP